MILLKTLCVIFIGGGTGSVLRYIIQQWLNTTSFAWGTIGVNTLGSFLIGLAAATLVRDSSPLWWSVLVIGFCGGFTTFSAFSLDAIMLLRQGQILSFALYITVSIALSIGCCALGYWIKQ